MAHRWGANSYTRMWDVLLTAVQPERGQWIDRVETLTRREAQNLIILLVGTMSASIRAECQDTGDRPERLMHSLIHRLMDEGLVLEFVTYLDDQEEAEES